VRVSATQYQTGFASESGDNVPVQSRSQDNYIQLKDFEVTQGECFNIQVAAGDASDRSFRDLNCF